MTPVRKHQLMAVFALAIAGGILGVIAFGGIEKNLVYFWDVAELLDKGEAAKGPTIRLGGVVENGSYQWDNQALELTFRIATQPENGKSIVVKSRGAPPQMFREGIGVVVEGSYDGATFTAARVIVKHSNEYQPPAPGEEPKKIYNTLLDGS